MAVAFCSGWEEAMAVCGRGSKSVLKCKEMFASSAAAAQLLGNKHNNRSTKRQRAEGGVEKKGVDRHTPAFKNKQPVACPFFSVCFSLFYTLRELEQN